MLMKHKNQIATAIKAACDKHGLHFRDFLPNFPEEASNNYVIKYRGSTHFFGVSEDFPGFGVRYRPGHDVEHFSVDVLEFEDANSWIERWVDAFLEEENAPDLWEEFSRTQPISILITTNNEPLTREEQTKALQAIEDVKARILELESSNQEANEDLKAHIESHISHLKEASNRAGKKDYILMFQATVFNTITSWMLSPEDRSAIWLFAMEQIRIQLIPDMVIPGLPS